MSNANVCLCRAYKETTISHYVSKSGRICSEIYSRNKLF